MSSFIENRVGHFCGEGNCRRKATLWLGVTIIGRVVGRYTDRESAIGAMRPISVPRLHAVVACCEVHEAGSVAMWKDAYV